jgi:hypothetical protein|nr:MAG TPA: Queuine tRNA-ribosyltransferase [Caudoviricetes sp.]
MSNHKKININCELPLGMLKSHNTKLNDMDFVLFHLFQHYPDSYGKYYLDLRKSKNNSDRIMILDNSAYEFYIKGEELDWDAYINTIYKLKPDYFILPDTLMNYQKTIEETTSFLTIDYANEIKELKEKYNIQPMAVLQGNSTLDFLNCIMSYADLGIKSIAIPFHNSFLADDYGKLSDIDWGSFSKYNLDLPKNQKTEKVESENRKEMDGSTKIVDKLVDKLDNNYARGRINWIHRYYHFLNRFFDYIHLLGSHNPGEINFYKDLKKNSSGDLLISSMDTGYPVKLTIDSYVKSSGKKIVKLGTEKQKPEIIIDEFFDKKLDNKLIKSIEDNVEIFRKLVSNNLLKPTIKKEKEVKEKPVKDKSVKEKPSKLPKEKPVKKKKKEKSKTKESKKKTKI